MKTKDLFIRKTFFIVAIAVMTLAVTTLAAAQGGTADGSTGKDRRIEGTWLTRVTFEDDFELKVLFTFMPGRDAASGTLIDANEYQLTPNPVCTADQGAWKKTGTRTYIATHYAFCFDADADYEPAGSVRVQDNIELNLQGNHFTGTQHIEIYDVGGEIIDVFDADMEGTLVDAANPPPPLARDRGRLGKRYPRLVWPSLKKPGI